MNGTWDANGLNEGSVWQDTFVGVSQPASFSPFYTFFRRLMASQGANFSNMPTDENIAFDEVNPAWYTWQTREAAREWASRVTQVVLIAIEWTLNAPSRNVVEGLIEAGNPLVRYAQEFYHFGEDGSHTPDDAITFYQDRGVVQRVTPIYIISNNWSKVGPDLKYARACCKNPGPKSAYDASIMRALSSVGAYDAFQWGYTYRDPNEPATGQPKACRAWDSVLASVYFRGG